MNQVKPNILLIMADQMMPFLMGAYGHPVVKTPNLDRLVKEGVRFDAAYSPCPVCSPARACLMTGKYTSTTGAYDNAALLPSDEPTMAHYLSAAGYDTALSGKMHFVGPDQLHGFRQRFVTNIYPADFSWTWMMTKFGRQANQAPQYVGEAIKVGRWNDALSYDEETHFRALEYLHATGLKTEQAQKGGEAPQPFFLCVSYHHPHERFWPPQALWDLYEGEEIDIPTFPDNLEETYSALDRWLNRYHNVKNAPKLKDPDSIRRVRRAYYALVTYIDLKVGELLDSLAENGFRDNTIVVFCSDHGDMLCEKGMVQKRTFYEWSSRVPLIIRFPDGWQQNTICTEPVNLIDLLPTFLDLADVDRDSRLAMDGRSLIALLDGSDTEDWVAISENHGDGLVEAPCFMIRQGRFKYIYIHGHDPQLFDLEADRGEWHNLAGMPEHETIETALRERILSQFEPDAIQKAVIDSFKRRILIDQAMQANGTRWDVEPRFDPTKPTSRQYLADK